MFGIRNIISLLIVSSLVVNVFAVKFFCTYIGQIQGVYVDWCSDYVGSLWAKWFLIEVGQYDCGNVVLNVALEISNNIQGTGTVSPGRSLTIPVRDSGMFSLKISRQSGTSSSCKFSVAYSGI